MSSKTTGIDQIRKRLERWELEHLRQHAAELAQRLEQAEAELAMAHLSAEAAWEAADAWRENADQLALDITAMGAQVAMNVDGQLHAVRGAA